MKLIRDKGVNTLLNKRMLTVIPLFLLAVGSVAYGHGGDEHADITIKTRANYVLLGALI